MLLDFVCGFDSSQSKCNFEMNEQEREGLTRLFRSKDREKSYNETQFSSGTQSYSSDSTYASNNSLILHDDILNSNIENSSQRHAEHSSKGLRASNKFYATEDRSARHDPLYHLTAFAESPFLAPKLAELQRRTSLPIVLHASSNMPHSEADMRPKDEHFLHTDLGSARAGQSHVQSDQPSGQSDDMSAQQSSAASPCTTQNVLSNCFERRRTSVPQVLPTTPLSSDVSKKLPSESATKSLAPNTDKASDKPRLQVNKLPLSPSMPRVMQTVRRATSSPLGKVTSVVSTLSPLLLEQANLAQNASSPSRPSSASAAYKASHSCLDYPKNSETGPHTASYNQTSLSTAVHEAARSQNEQSSISNFLHEARLPHRESNSSSKVIQLTGSPQAKRRPDEEAEDGFGLKRSEYQNTDSAAWRQLSPLRRQSPSREEALRILKRLGDAIHDLDSELIATKSGRATPEGYHLHPL